MLSPLFTPCDPFPLSSRPLLASRNLSPVIVNGAKDRLSHVLLHCQASLAPLPRAERVVISHPINHCQNLQNSWLTNFQILQKAAEEFPLQTFQILSGRDQTGSRDPREDRHWLSGTKTGAELTCMRLIRLATGLGLPSTWWTLMIFSARNRETTSSFDIATTQLILRWACLLVNSDFSIMWSCFEPMAVPFSGEVGASS